MPRPERLWPFTLRVIILHTATYFLFGIVMSNLFAYRDLLSAEIISAYMRPFGSAFIYAGPFLQPLRGLLFALAIWPFRDVVYGRKLGWLYLWGAFLVFGILSTPAAAPSSIEGVLYTNLPLSYHLVGLPEITLQTLAFSLLTVAWERQIGKRAAGGEEVRKRPWLRSLLHSVVLACFAYMGYAVGGITLALLSGAGIDLAESGSNIKLQFMFMVAFVFNIAFILLVKLIKSRRRIAFCIVPVVFVVVDVLVPYAYQSVFLARPPLPMSIALGMLPATIITAGIYLSDYRHRSGQPTDSRPDGDGGGRGAARRRRSRRQGSS